MTSDIDELIAHHEEENYEKTIFGFWTYLMTDCVIFATFFAAYAVLHNMVFDGPTSQEIFNPKLVLAETFALLISSFTCGLAGINSKKGKKGSVLAYLGITFLLGLSFVGMEIHEFVSLIKEGHGPDRSAFLSSFFTLVGTHGIHVSFGLIWMIVIMKQIMSRGFPPVIHKRLMCFRLFWHFLDVVWIFIFTLVYMLGVIK